jgi:3-oxoacyl-[acyl-carrier protein] reductase
VTRLLDGRTAIVYGAAGPIGSAVASAFADAGATVFLAGRTRARLEAVARGIDRAEVAPVDVLDPAATRAHADAIAAATGRIDVAFNAVANDDIQGTPLLDMAPGDVTAPVTKAVTAHLHLATAVGRHMVARRSGVILAMGGGREAIPRLGGAHVAWAALAGLCRQLAAELGPHGIRALWLLSPGSPDADAPDQAADVVHTLLRRRPTLAEVGAVAAFLASDGAATMTATEVNITGGAVVD